jgi:RNA polymerase sigma-70 factor, ECF subfamily
MGPAAAHRRTEVPEGAPRPIDRPIDRTDFAAIVHRHDDRLRGLAYKLLAGDRHRMDDALQEAYLRAYRALPGFRVEADLGTWLYRIVYNACIDELRRDRRRPRPIDLHEAGWDQPAPASPHDEVVYAADATVRALRALPDEQRVALVLVDGEGFDNVAAARILGVPPGTVGSRLSRARATVRRLLEEDDR